MSDVIHEDHFDDEAPTLKMVRLSSAGETPRRAKQPRYELRAKGKVYRHSTSVPRLLEWIPDGAAIPDGAKIYRGRTEIATYRHTHRTPGGRILGIWEMTSDGVADSRVA